MIQNHVLLNWSNIYIIFIYTFKKKEICIAYHFVWQWVKSVFRNKQIHLFTLLLSLSTGYLSVCLSGSWKERWCVVREGSLYLQKDPGDQRPPVTVVPLKGAEVVPGGLGPKHPLSFCILQAGNELASLEVLYYTFKNYFQKIHFNWLRRFNVGRLVCFAWLFS